MAGNTLETLGRVYKLQIIICCVFTILENMSDDRCLCFDAVSSSAKSAVKLIVWK